ncbi:PREDICTED: uncharacterized protein LOC105154428 isoform X3 [Acromyrmex echinatior]|uniref:uncharacterized protein LOC105154428 isoform X3 n=1 Tax=Acromyrmex echinatior TaxID=103372 RepID=UPI000580F1EC|nr:PREDICTED: uncharacterized protein LOC105154428 isoform X3 [Acromyrmex echinatior]
MRGCCVLRLRFMKYADGKLLGNTMPSAKMSVATHTTSIRTEKRLVNAAKMCPYRDSTDVCMSFEHPKDIPRIRREYPKSILDKMYY